MKSMQIKLVSEQCT